MGDKSAIEWTEATWNPTTGCTKVSPGCAHCYAETLSLRFGWSKKPWIPAHEAENVILHPERLAAPLRWKKPRRVFVDSMSDLFHDNVPSEFIDRVFAVMALTPQHTYQVLTKRPERMRKYVRNKDVAHRITSTLYVVEPRPTDMDIHFAKQGRTGGNETGMLRWPLENLWLGVSVENQRWADARIPILLDTPAAVRFVSCEPLLGPLDLRAGFRDRHWSDSAYHADYTVPEMLLDWVIVGGESAGPTARRLVEPCCRTGSPFPPPAKDRHRLTYDPANPDSICERFNSGACDLKDWQPKPDRLEWVRSLRDQCVAAGVPYFFKQWGGPKPKSAGALLDGREWREFPS